MTPTEKAIRDFCGHHADWWPSASQVQAMLALAQTQEPLAWEQFHEHMAGPNYVAPQRTWVGLTDEEIETLIHRFDGDPHTLLDEVNARLKEKNP